MEGCGLGDLRFLLQPACAQWDGWNEGLGTFLCGWISYKLWCSGSYRGYSTSASTSMKASFDSDSSSMANLPDIYF